MIDPADPLITRKNLPDNKVYPILVNGSSQQKLDLVFLSEGYTLSQESLFLADCKRFTAYLFSFEPYKSLQKDFNVRAVFIASAGKGADLPQDGKWSETAFDASYYTFRSDRYLTTESYWKVCDAASQVAWDQILLMVNSDVYGGGGIYNHYSVFASSAGFSEEVFLHEFGHAFGGLGDEYYDSEVSYSGFYPLNEEPNVPNLTTLVDFNRKWKAMIPEGTPQPTPVNLWKPGIPGLFEGGGYTAKGIYRAEPDCRMRSNTADGFCVVCRDAIIRRIRYFCGN